MNGTSLWRKIDGTGIPVVLSRLIVGGTFVYLAFHKIAYPVKFLKDIREYHLLPDSIPLLFNFSAVALPWIEILAGTLLILGLWLRGSAAVVMGLMIFFTAAIFMRALGVYGNGHVAFCAIEFDCGCGSGVINICNKLLTNVSLTGLTLIVLVSRCRRWALETLPAASPTA